MDKFPILSEDLIAELDRLHPPIPATAIMKMNQRELDFKAGQRAVVESLLMVLARAKEEDLLDV